MKRTKSQQGIDPRERDSAADPGRPFDAVDDFVIEEIALWLLAPMYAGESPTERMVRDLSRFAATCGRMFRIIYRPPHSCEIWKLVDVGALIGEMIPSKIELMESLPQIASCSKLSMPFGTLNSTAVSLIRSMPNLTDLGVDVCGEIQLGSSDVTDAIRSLRSLTRLRIRGIEEVDPTGFPKKLADLDIRDTVTCRLFGANGTSLVSVESLSLGFGSDDYVAHLSDAIRACPSVTSLKLDLGHKEIWPEEMATIWETCTGLREISISFAGDCSMALDEFERSECCANIEKLSLDIAEENVWSRIIRRCPNIVELSMAYPRPSARDIGELSALKRLEVLRVDCFGDDDELDAFSESFDKLGRSDGIPLKRIALTFVKFDLGGFFSSRRCRGLREVSFSDCTIRGEDIAALADNARDSLVSLEVSRGNEWSIVPLLAGRSRVNRLVMENCTKSQTGEIGKMSEAPLEVVAIGNQWSLFTDGMIAKIAPALANVIDLTIYGDGHSDGAIVELVSKCRRLRRLATCTVWGRKLFAKILGPRPDIDVRWL
jgi:hypothetical protein